MDSLRSIDWQIYNILKSQNDWITQKRLCLKLIDYQIQNQVDKDNKFNIALHNEYMAIKEMSNDEFHNTNWRKMIGLSIRTLNESDTIQKIILSTGKGIKIASQTEYEHFIGRKIMSAVRHLQRVKKLADKASMDGQMRIVFNRERDTIEAFIKNYEEIDNDR